MHGLSLPEITCAICKTPAKSAEERSVFLSCAHSFHLHCIYTWIDGKEAPSCPICRNVVNKEDKEYVVFEGLKRTLDRKEEAKQKENKKKEAQAFQPHVPDVKETTLNIHLNPESFFMATDDSVVIVVRHDGDEPPLWRVQNQISEFLGVYHPNDRSVSTHHIEVLYKHHKSFIRVTDDSWRALAKKKQFLNRIFEVKLSDLKCGKCDDDECSVQFFLPRITSNDHNTNNSSSASKYFKQSDMDLVQNLKAIGKEKKKKKCKKKKEKYGILWDGKKSRKRSAKTDQHWSLHDIHDHYKRSHNRNGSRDDDSDEEWKKAKEIRRQARKERQRYRRRERRRSRYRSRRRGKRRYSDTDSDSESDEWDDEFETEESDDWI
eukprot:247810_1